jgi:hypothetical protein
MNRSAAHGFGRRVKDILIRGARARLWLDAARFARALGRPEEIQQRVLRDKLAQFASTEYGRRHSYAAIANYRDFRRLPITDYEDIRGEIERTMAGDWRFFLPEKPVMYGVTSGTTGASKYIPFTRTFVREYRRGANVWGYHLAHDHPEALRNILVICSPACEGFTEGGFPYGQISGLIAEMQNPLVRTLYALPNSIFNISDCHARYYVIARCGIEQDVTHLHTANFSTVLRLVKVADEHRDDLIRDVHDGRLLSRLNVEPAIRARLSFRPNPHRAHELEEMVKRAGGRLLPKDYWPNLCVIGCWCGGTQSFFLNHRAKYFRPEMLIRDIGLLSTEARASIPLNDEDDAGVLEIASHFFEFIPENEIQSKQPTVLTVGDLAAGHRYFMLLTTSSGLFRYNINDLVEVVGFVKRTPTIRFLNKGSHISSLVGEKLSESQVVSAMHNATNQIGVPVNCFKMCPVVEEVPYYKLIVELDGYRPLPDALLETLGRGMDEELSRLNTEYARKRVSQRLAGLCVQRVRTGTFDGEREAIVRANNGREFQYKHKYLENDPLYHERFQFSGEHE